MDGKTIVLDFRFAKGNIDALTGLAAELVRIAVDVIVADATPATRAAFDATRTMPIVIGAAGDPVHLGFVASIRPHASFVSHIVSVICAKPSRQISEKTATSRARASRWDQRTAYDQSSQHQAGVTRPIFHNVPFRECVSMTAVGPFPGITALQQQRPVYSQKQP